MEIKRDLYLNKLINRKHNGLIKVITGIRRSRKSYLLFTIFGNYLKSQGVADDHIIAIGDASNDVEMFQLAGIPIAMKNSDDFTKSHAKIITPFDNDNDGIMYALKEIIK